MTTAIKFESPEAKAQYEAKILKAHNVAVGQVYMDNDPRENGRKLTVLGVATKPGKATCAFTHQGRVVGKTTYISFKRLATKRLFTLIEWRVRIPHRP